MTGSEGPACGTALGVTQQLTVAGRWRSSGWCHMQFETMPRLTSGSKRACILCSPPALQLWIPHRIAL